MLLRLLLLCVGIIAPGTTTALGGMALPPPSDSTMSRGDVHIYVCIHINSEPVGASLKESIIEPRALRGRKSSRIQGEEGGGGPL